MLAERFKPVIGPPFGHFSRRDRRQQFAPRHAERQRQPIFKATLAG